MSTTIHHEVARHYDRFPYPKYSLLGSVRTTDTYALNLEALWAAFNGERLTVTKKDAILLAGCGTFSPYPTAVANPRAAITALDLSPRSLFRARLHALRHLKFNIRYVTGDLLDPLAAPGPFRFIDTYGVLHHIPDFQGALTGLAARLVDGGIMRIMLYSRDGRAWAEEIREECRKAGITTVRGIKKLAKRDPRIREYLDNSYELTFREGIADAFLHPYARTFTIDEVMDALGKAGLTVLRFCHEGALLDVEKEINRVKRMENTRTFDTNLVLYAGKNIRNDLPRTHAVLNPCLVNAVRFGILGTLDVMPKMGLENPPLDRAGRKFLKRFITPFPLEKLSRLERITLQKYIDALFVMEISEKGLKDI
jgi:SAM-dependent methyltransferase